MRVVRHFLSDLRRRGVHRAVAYYIAGAWIAVEVVATLVPILGLPSWAPRLALVLAALGLPAAMVVSWLFDLTPAGFRRDDAAATPPLPRSLRTRVVALGVLGVLLAGAGYSAFRRLSEAQLVEPLSIAVLPFLDPSGDADGGFGRGLAGELTAALGRLEEVRVIGMQSVLPHDRAPRDAQSVGRELAVAWVVDGSASRSADRLHVTAAVVNVRTGQTAWQAERDGPAMEGIAVRRELIAGIAGVLRSDAQQRGLLVPPTSSAAAYDAYLQGRGHEAGGPGGLEAAVEAHRRAIAGDPSFASAHASISSVFARMRSELGAGPELVDSAVVHAQRAVALDPALPEAHAALAIARVHAGDWDGAVAAAERALELNPSNTGARILIGNHEARRGAWDEAVIHWERALAGDPIGAGVAMANIGTVYLSLGFPELADQSYQRALEINPANTWAQRGLIYAAIRAPDPGTAVARAMAFARERPLDANAWLAAADAHLSAGDVDAAHAAAARAYELSPGAEGRTHYARVVLAYTEALRGNEARASELLAQFERFARQEIGRGSQNYLLHYGIATAHAIRGDAGEAARWLEQAVDMGWSFYFDTSDDPMLSSVRGDERIEAIVRRLETRVMQMRTRFEQKR